MTRAARWKIARMRATRRVWFIPPSPQSRPLFQREFDALMKEIYSAPITCYPVQRALWLRRQ